jgi:gliding motility-associated-like protein
VYATGGTYNVTLTVTTAAGCSSGIIKTVTVNPKPVASFTVNNLCYSGSATFTNTSSIASGTISNYLWDFGDAATSTLQNPTHAYTTAGTYNVTLTVTSALGCSSTTTLPFNMQPAPVADFTATTACATAPLTFTNTSTVVSGSTPTWSWDFGDATSSTLQNPSHTYATGGTYNVTLTVTTAAGCTNSIVKTVTVNPKPVASFTANNMCYVGSVTFTNTSTIASGTISSYNWDFGDATTSTLQNPTHVYSTAGTYNVTLTATSALGCSTTTTVAVNMQPAPVANFNFTPACSGAPVIFNNTSTVVSGSTPSWSWDFGDVTSSTAQNPSHSYASGGTYNVILTVTTAAGCTSSLSQSLTINPTPVAAFIANSMCYVDSVTFSNTSSISTGSITGYSWDFGDATTSTLLSPDHYYATAGTYNVTLIATSNSGCKDTTVVSINMQPAPLADFTFTSACANVPIGFNNTSVVVNGSAPSWSWNFGDATSSTLQNPSHSYSADGTYNISLTVTTAAGCTSTATQPLTINQTPVAAFTANNMCYADSVTFTNTSSISAGSITGYNWNFGDATTSTLQSPDHFYANAGIYNVTLIATSGFGCSDTTILAIDMQPAPIANFNTSTVCANAVANFTNTSTVVPGSAPSWNWYFGDSNTSTLQNPSNVYATGTIYNITLTVTTAAGCVNTITKPLIIDPTPVAAFTVNSMCYADSVTFTNTSNINSGTISGYTWNFGDATSGTLQNPDHYYASAGLYTVTLVANTSLGCSDTVTSVIDMQPKPNADFISAGNCANSSITFTNTSVAVTGTNPSWNWNFGDSNTSTLQNPINQYSTDGTYNVSLVATSLAGCTDTVTKALTIDPAPVAGFTTNSMCYIDSVRFTNSSFISSGSITSYAWDFGDGSSSTLTNPSHFYATSGVFNVTLTITSSTGCSDTIVTAVNVQPAPVVDFTFPAACENLSFNFTNTSTLSSGTFSSWNWNFGDSNSSTIQNPGYTYITPGTYNVTLIGTATSGCADTIVKTIIVNPGPAASFTSTNPCSIDSIQFTNTSTIGIGSITSQNWAFGDGNSTGISNPSHLYGAVGSYTVTLIVNSDLGCADTSSAIINASLLSPGFTDNGPACQGVGINFNDTSLIDVNTTITGWNWSFGDGTFSTVQNPTHPYNAGGSYTVQLIVTTASGCLDSATHIVNIQGFPSANAGNDTSKCANNPTIGIGGVVLNAGGGQWFGNGSFNPNPFVLNPIYTPSAAAIANGFDTLLLVTTSNALCPADTDQVVINFYPGPTVNAGSDITVCKDTANVPVCANITMATGGMWQTMGTGTFVDDSASCTQYIPSTADTAFGSVVLVVTSTGNSDCFAISDTVTLFFTPTPVVMITSNDSTCAGNPYFLGVTTTTGSGYWATSGSGSFTPANTTLNGVYYPSAADDAAGNVTLYFNSSNNGGCRVQSDTLDLTLIPSPINAFTSVVACPSLPTLFTDASTSTVAINNWSWTFGDGGTSTSQNPSHVYGAGGPYNVSLITTSVNGCVDTVTQVVNIYYKPNAGFDANGICLNDGTQFTDTSSVGNSTITNWSWSFGDGASSTIQNPLHVYPSGNTYNSTLIVQSGDGCKDTVMQSIGVLPNPTADFTADDFSVDVDQTAQFHDQSSSLVNSWLWDFGDSQTDSTSTSQNPSHVYHTGGFYDVCLYVTDVNGCTDTICKPIVVSLPPVVPSGFSPNGDGENDMFSVYGGPFKELEFRIYNNWGELIFTSNKQEDGWDGRRKGVDQPIGVYVYIIYAVTENDEEYRLSGDVTLLR